VQAAAWEVRGQVEVGRIVGPLARLLRQVHQARQEEAREKVAWVLGQVEACQARLETVRGLNPWIDWPKVEASYRELTGILREGLAKMAA
jgi:hypothetical protein